MEKNLSLPKDKANDRIITETMANILRAPVEWLRKYYSDVLGEEISLCKTIRLIHAQVAFITAVFPTGGSLLIHACCCLWFAWALLKCRD